MDRGVFLRGYLAMLAITIVGLAILPKGEGLAFAVTAAVLVLIAALIQLDVERDSRRARDGR